MKNGKEKGRFSNRVIKERELERVKKLFSLYNMAAGKKNTGKIQENEDGKTKENRLASLAQITKLERGKEREKNIRLLWPGKKKM